jgi:hypothetical protein
MRGDIRQGAAPFGGGTDDTLEVGQRHRCTLRVLVDIIQGVRAER